jgi:hypothetical protein
MVAHPSAYELEAFSVSALTPSVADHISAHLDDCPTCAKAIEALGAEAVEFSRLHPPTRLFNEVERRGRRRRLALGGVLASTAALALVLLKAAAPDELRARGGGPAVEVYLAHEAELRHLQTVDEPALVRPGDAVRVELSLAHRAWVAAFFLDELGAVSWYVPDQAGAQAIAVGPGTALLPGSAVFDDSKASERLFVVIREAPFSPASVAAEVSAAWRNHPSQPFTSNGWLPNRDLPSYRFRRAP